MIIGQLLPSTCAMDGVKTPQLRRTAKFRILLLSTTVIALDTCFSRVFMNVT